jgi:hypothetical protein
MEEKWKSHELKDYSFVYATEGFSPRVHARIQVRDNQVVSVENFAQLDVSVETAPTIDKLFQNIEGAYDDEVEVTVEYDKKYGIPLFAYFDGGEEGYGFRVVSFEPAPSASGAEF